MYETCRKRGAYKDITINKDKVQSSKENAQTLISGAKKLAKILAKEDKEWLNVFLNTYDALHLLAESYLRSKGLRANDHKCLYAYITEQTGIEGFEKLRKARNDTHYYGQKFANEKLEKLSKEGTKIYEKLLEEFRDKSNQ